MFVKGVVGCEFIEIERVGVKKFENSISALEDLGLGMQISSSW